MFVLVVPACLCLLFVLLFLPVVLLRVTFCGWGDTALSRCQTVLAHDFPTGVTRNAHQSAQPRPLPVSRAADPEPQLSSCAPSENHDRTADVCHVSAC